MSGDNPTQTSVNARMEIAKREAIAALHEDNPRLTMLARGYWERLRKTSKC